MPGWSNLMPMVIFLPPAESPFLPPPHAVTDTARASTAAEAAVALRNFMVGILRVVRRTKSGSGGGTGLLQGEAEPTVQWCRILDRKSLARSLRGLPKNWSGAACSPMR